MMKPRVFFVCLFFMAVFFVSFSSYAQTPQETLNQFISDLQKSPNDTALREKIIRHVQTMKKAPAIPEEARRHYVKARTLFEDAKQPSDSADAAEEFRQALLIAPWWGEAYMKMGLALETAQRYDEAIASLKLFMATNPQDEVLRKAQDEIYKIEAKAQKAAKDREKAAKESSPEAIAAQEQKKFAELLKKIDGRRYKQRISPGAIYRLVVDVQGKILVLGRLFKDDPNPYRYPTCSHIEFQGRVSTCSYQDDEYGLVEVSLTISEDGDRITGHTRYGGKVSEVDYGWP